MTRCGCRKCHKASHEESNHPDHNSQAHESVPGVVLPNNVAEVLLQPEIGDALAQTIGVPQAAMERRQSSVRRILSQRQSSVTPSEINVALGNLGIFEGSTASVEAPILAVAPTSSIEATGVAESLKVVAPSVVSPRGSNERDDSLHGADIGNSDPTALSKDSPPAVVVPSVAKNLQLFETTSSREDGSVKFTDQKRTLSLGQEETPSGSDAGLAKSITTVPAEDTSAQRQIESATTTNQAKVTDLDAIDTVHQLLLQSRQRFLWQWLEILQSCCDDVGHWELDEALLKAHILSRLVRIDCERTQAVLEGNDAVLDEIRGSASCILPVDGNLPFLESLLPAEVLVDIGGGADILTAVKQHASATELESLKEFTRQLVARCKDTSSQALQEKWNAFGEIMSVFDLNQRVSFDIPPVSLMSQETVELWNAAIEPFGASMTNDALRIQSAPPTAPNVDCKKKGFRRSLSRGVKKVGRKIKYRKKNKPPGEEVEPWIAEEKPQLSLAYRLHRDGNVSVKVRCKLPVAFINMLIVLDDINGFKSWLPYCTDVDLIKKYGTASYLLRYIAEMPWPIKKRETLAFCEGIDALDEIGQLVVLVKNPPLSSDQDTIFGDPLPAPLPKIPRIPKCALVFFVRPIEPEVTGVELFARLDPGMNVKLLRGIIPWLVKNVSFIRPTTFFSQSVVDFMVKIANLAQKLQLDQILGDPQRDTRFYELIRTRGAEFLATSTPEEVPEPLTEKQRRALGFDDSDLLWFEKLPVLKL